MTPIYLPEDAVEQVSSPAGEPEPETIREPEMMPVEAFATEPVSAPLKKEEPSVKDLDPLMDLDSAMKQIPGALREEMQELLRADFREVVRWKA